MGSVYKSLEPIQPTGTIAKSQLAIIDGRTFVETTFGDWASKSLAPKRKTIDQNYVETFEGDLDRPHSSKSKLDSLFEVQDFEVDYRNTGLGKALHHSKERRLKSED